MEFLHVFTLLLQAQSRQLCAASASPFTSFPVKLSTAGWRASLHLAGLYGSVASHV